MTLVLGLVAGLVLGALHMLIDTRRPSGHRVVPHPIVATRAGHR
jgi:xanthosine utilization system XapX-like protein